LLKEERYEKTVFALLGKSKINIISMVFETRNLIVLIKITSHDGNT